MTAFEAVFIDGSGVEVPEERIEFEYRVEGHESFAMMRPEFSISLAIDAPSISLAALQTHVGGFIETTVSSGWLLVVNADGLMRDPPMRPNPHPDLISRSALLGSPLCGPVVVIRPRTAAGSASSSPSTASVPDAIA